MTAFTIRISIAMALAAGDVTAAGTTAGAQTGAQSLFAAAGAGMQYRLTLPNAEEYRLHDLPDYRLQPREARPAPPADAVPRAARPLRAPAPPFHAQVLAAAHASGLEPALIHAVIRVESAYNPAAVSPSGAIGLMQLMPVTAARYGVKNSKDPVENIRGGTQYLRHLKRMFDGDLSLALAAYNAGENAVLRYGRAIPRFPQTLHYVPTVLAEYQRMRASLAW